MSAELAGITGPGTAFLAGLVTSLHCAGMCGPLACALVPVRARETDPQAVITVYHVSRLAGYTALGALAGGVGRFPLVLLGADGVRWLPWLIVAFFIAAAFRLDQRLPNLPLLGRAYSLLIGRVQKIPPLRAAAAVGLATPLLPCGALYFLLSLALLAGSAVRGAECLLAFGLGTVPLLWFVQANAHWLQLRLGARSLARGQSLLALGVAGVLIWRLRGSLGFDGPGVNDFVCF